MLKVFLQRAIALLILPALPALFASSAPAQIQGAATQLPPDNLWRQATLYRDDWGVPHIFGENPRSLAFALGYAQAEDHLEAMLLAYRSAEGRVSELLGESHAESDAFALKVGHALLAQAAWDTVDDITRDLCEGFVAGVNLWMYEHQDAAPAWKAPVMPWEVLALWHAYLAAFAPFDLPGVYHPPLPSKTGNAWALAPERTVEGKALLVINPHQYHNGHFRWYEAHLTAYGFNVAGVTLFGLPLILQGHNDVLGWALTPNTPDYADMLSLGIPDQGPASAWSDVQIQYQVLLQSYREQQQAYQVLGSNGLEERRVSAMLHDEGPVFEGAPDRLYAWKVGGYGEFGGLLQLFDMARAQNLEMFQEAVAQHQIPCFHIVYADSEGNIFYLYNTKVLSKQDPLAGLPMDWTQPVPAEAAYLTAGPLVAPAGLPYLLNPEGGYVQACGNPPWQATFSRELEAPYWPHWLASDPYTLRAQRVHQLLLLKKRSFADALSMLYDTTAPALQEFAPLLSSIKAMQTEIMPPGAAMPAGLATLEAWKGTAETDDPAMTVFQQWWRSLRVQPGLSLLSQQELRAALLRNTPEARDVAFRTLSDLTLMQQEDPQGLPVPWGEAHRIRRGEQEDAIFGSELGETLFVTGEEQVAEGRWEVNYGYGFAMVVQFGATPEVASISPFGASELPGKPHYADQMGLMLDKRFKQSPFLSNDVYRLARHARGSRIIFYPLYMDGSVTLESEFPIDAYLNTVQESPIALPKKLARFSPFMEPVLSPLDASVNIYLDLLIPDIVCQPGQIHRLAVFAYTQNEGWQAVAEQQQDQGARIIHARHQGAALYVVLGPESALGEHAAEVLAPAPSPKGTRSITDRAKTIDAPGPEQDLEWSPEEQMLKAATLRMQQIMQEKAQGTPGVVQVGRP
jgi:acyl-homoserine-lactone acylase